MKSNTVVPLLSLSEDAMIKVFSQMENTDLIRTSKACSFTNRVVISNGRTFSSRPQFGSHFMFEAFRGGFRGAVQLVDDAGKIKMPVYFQIDDIPYFLQQIAPISISKLSIRVFDRNVIPKMMEILKKWKPICADVHIYDYMKDAHLFEMIGYLKCQKSMKIALRHREFRKTINEVKKFQNNAMYSFNVDVVWTEKDDILETMRPFGEFRTRTSPEYMNQLFIDLAKSGDFGNLRRFNIFVPNRNNGTFPYLPSGARTPQTTTLLAQEEHNSKERPRSIRKLALANHMCALIVELWEDPPTRYGTSKMEIQVEIMKNDDEQILDFILKKYFIQCKFFTKENRKRYLAMNDENRAKKMKLACGVN